VFAQGVVAVRLRGQVEQPLHRGDVIGAHFPPYLDPMHPVRLPPRFFDGRPTLVEP
jgi:hypothetical protein